MSTILVPTRKKMSTKPTMGTDKVTSKIIERSVRLAQKKAVLPLVINGEKSDYFWVNTKSKGSFNRSMNDPTSEVEAFFNRARN